MLLTVNFPSWLKPEIIPGLPFRWYGLMYLVAFGIAFLLYRRQVRERNYPMNDDSITSLYFWGILGLLLGARIFATIVYEVDDIYVRSPWLIFWPFRNGRFVGLQGMSYHGGVIGGILGVVLFTKVKKFHLRDIGDMVAVSIPLGYTFGRLGNFINGELYGRVTASSWGMVFPNAEPLSLKLGWVKEIALKAGLAVGQSASYINLPRHPSQLYEAFFEGVLLWAILWLLRKHRPFRGFLMGLYFIGYGFFRFFIEYFREPDKELGYRIVFVKNNIDPALYSTPFNFSTGQILCFLMVLGGCIWLFAASRLPDAKDEPGSREAEEVKTKEEREANRKLRRKLRKKLK